MGVRRQLKIERKMNFTNEALKKRKNSAPQITTSFKVQVEHFSQHFLQQQTALKQQDRVRRLPRLLKVKQKNRRIFIINYLTCATLMSIDSDEYICSIFRL